MVKKSLLKRKERIKQNLLPKVEVTHAEKPVFNKSHGLSIPGGIFVSSGHTWASVGQDGDVRIGIDDFAKKTIGAISDIELPNLGMPLVKGQTVFSIKQGKRTIPFKAPLSGKISKVNTKLSNHPDQLDTTVYDKNWMCVIDADNLDEEVSSLKIGKSAVVYYLEELERFQKYIKGLKKDNSEIKDLVEYYHHLDECITEQLDDKQFSNFVNSFFGK
jgi:glycine cleavage system H lipoate-binding protein